MMAMSSAGKAKTKSLSRMIAWSTPPRRSAASRPSGTPMPVPMPTATNDTAIEVPAPRMIIDSMSRPNWSVPEPMRAGGRLQLGGDVRCAVGSYGVQTSETRRHQATQSTTTAAEHEAAMPQGARGEALRRQAREAPVPASVNARLRSRGSTTA